MEIRILKFLFLDLLRRFLAQNQGKIYLVFESLPSRKFRYFNISLASKGPSAVAANMRTMLIRTRTKHRLMVMSELGTKSLSKHFLKDFDHAPNVRGTFLIPQWTKSPYVLFDLINRNPNSRFVLGPNLSILLGKDNSLSHEICSFIDHQSNQFVELIFPCPRVKEIFTDSADSCLSKHSFVRVLPTGIDDKYWMPSKVEGRNVLVYKKGKLSLGDFEILETLEKHYRSRFDMINYGEYSQAQYRMKLREAKVVVFLAGPESQSLAQFEAWSCNVPTLVRVPKFQTIEPNRRSQYGSESTDFAPYLSIETGHKFTELFELEELLTSFDSGKLAFSPRDYVLKNYGMIDFKKKIFTH